MLLSIARTLTTHEPVSFIVELHELIEAAAGDVEKDVYNKLMYL
jgi:hypothetical protein